MKEGWSNCKIGDICSITDFVSNGSFASLKENVKYYNSPNYAVLVRLADASNGFDKSKFVYTDEHGYDFSKKSHLHGGELIMSNVGSVGSMFICPVMKQPMTLAPNTISITSQNNTFLYYYFLSDEFKAKLKGITSSTTLKKFNKTNFKLLEICIPSLSEQQSIVDYLDSAFAKIDAMKANAEKALNEAKSLFQASLKEMLEPKEGWEEKKLETLTSKIGSGATPKGGRKVYINKGCNLIRSMNVQYNEFKYEDLAHITDEAAEQLKGVEIKENDVLFNITGASIARCCVVPTDVLPARVNQHVSILRLKQEVLPRFLSYILNSPKHQKELLKIGEAGSTRQALTKTDLENHVICYPNIDGQTKLLCTLDSLKSKVDRLQENYDKISQECDALKQAILRQVFE